MTQPERPLHDQPLTEQPASGRAETERPANERAAGNRPIAETLASEQPAQGRGEGSASGGYVPESPVAEPVTGRPVSERGLSERPLSERPVSERPAPERSASGRAATESPLSESPLSEGAGPESRASERPVTERSASESSVSGRHLSDHAAPGAGSEPGGPAGDDAVLPPQEREKLQLRLQHAVGGFVDEPRSAVEEAAATVDSLTERVLETLEQRRGTLRASWQEASGDAATEDLRMALREYRRLAERLLSL
ncbi:hypothetical protein N4G70_08080 [Streptomyces sp. ASQP_92]|uniref:hypothetical protein n=1 Tax=Streptomyces sp. ASQP_92 TaxID=2979116 RepID=UPI0021C1EA47|nr:hypothetical protein [Streptomyces sp. ASQP_92]MCT9088824.1 hypothetical protein [Streptomyces sp. ASQP_92]